MEHSLRTHSQALSEYAHVQRAFREGVDSRYPWRSHGQPVTMYLALFGCLFLLFVANGAALWNGFHTTPFLSAYLAVSHNLVQEILALTKVDADICLAACLHRILGSIEGTQTW